MKYIFLVLVAFLGFGKIPCFSASGSMQLWASPDSVKGKVTSCEVYYVSGEGSHIIRTKKAAARYNIFGKRVEEAKYQDNAISETKTIVFDDYKRITEIITNHDNKNTKEILKYDEKGNYTLSLFYNTKGELTSKVVNTYNLKGECVSEKVVELHAGNEPLALEETKNTFDAKGNKTSSAVIGAPLSMKTVYIYDRNRRVTESRYFQGDMKVAAITEIMKYDNNRNLVEKQRKSGDGSIVSKVTYKYDIDNNLIEEEIYDAVRMSNLKIEYVYSQ